MSYNIDSSEYVEGCLSLTRGNAICLLGKYKDRLPECNFLDELELQGDLTEVLAIEQPWWYGEGSGYTFETLQEILTYTTGKAKILFVWEGGDSQSALIVNEGVATEGKVKIVIE